MSKPNISWMDVAKLTADGYFHVEAETGSVLYCSPTSNCQTTSIGGSQVLLNSEDKHTYFREFAQKFNKSQVIIDVQAGYEDKVEDLCSKNGNRIIGQIPYTSTNQSKMILYLLYIERQ